MRSSKSIERSLSVLLGAGTVALLAFAAAACGSNNEATTGCSALSACCATLSGGEAQSCQNAVKTSGATEAQCNQALAGFHMSGVCGGGGDSGSGGNDGGGGSGDGGTHADTGSSGDAASSPSCSALAACCPDVPVTGDPMACWTVAKQGTDKACAESLASYAMAGYCTAGATDAGTDTGSAGDVYCYLTMGTGSSETCLEAVISMAGTTCSALGTLIGMTLTSGRCPSAGLYGCCIKTSGALAGAEAVECYYGATTGAAAKSSCTGSMATWSNLVP